MFISCKSSRLSLKPLKCRMNEVWKSQFSSLGASCPLAHFHLLIPPHAPFPPAKTKYRDTERETDRQRKRKTHTGFGTSAVCCISYRSSRQKKRTEASNSKCHLFSLLLQSSPHTPWEMMKMTAASWIDWPIVYHLFIMSL